MSWAEFCIKSFAYKRMMETQLRQTRKIAFWSAIGSHLDPKSLPKSEIKFMKIGDEIVIAGATDKQKEAFKEEYKNYLKERDAVLAKRTKEN